MGINKKLLLLLLLFVLITVILGDLFLMSVQTKVSGDSESNYTESSASVIGDANSDGKLNVRDAAFIASALAQGKTNTLPKSSDYNMDGSINVRDAAAIAKFLSSQNQVNDKKINIYINVNGKTLSAVLYDNPTAKAFAEKLPITLPMLDLYGREMCYRFDEALPTDNVQYTGYEVGEIVYWPPRHSFVIMYAQNGEEFEMQKVGKIESGVEIFDGIGNVDVAFSMNNVNTNVNDGFVQIKGGTFTMGSPEDEPEREADEVQHDVTVGNFFMSPTEVTQKEYQAVMGGNPSERKGDDLPVTNVSWYDAIDYCNRLSKEAGLTAAYTINEKTITWNKSSDGYRLPTEAEWEFAARAATATPFSFGDYVYDENANCYNAYGYNNNSSGSWVNGYLEKTTEVKSYPANDNGLYDIHGNAAEWVWDWYGEYDKKAVTDPTGNENGNYKVARGGAWNDFPKHIRSAYRSANAPDVGTYGIGIRLARGAVGKGNVISTFNEVEQKKNKKILIAYFSQTGNTKGLTDIIADMTGADVFHIERHTDYSATHNAVSLYTEALNELRGFAAPDLKTSLEEAVYNIDDYDTILLGYCNWWASIPAPVRTLLKTYDMSGKTIIPYCSMGGGRFGQTISAISKLAPNSNIKEGLDTVYSSYNKERIKKWLTDNGIYK